MSRFKFNSRMHQSREAITKYVTALKKLSSECEYGTFLPDLLRGQLICSIAGTTIQRSMLKVINVRVCGEAPRCNGDREE